MVLNKFLESLSNIKDRNLSPDFMELNLKKKFNRDILE